VRVPYNRRAYPPSLNAAERSARAGYAVVLDDLRGTGDSQGRLLPYEHAITDGSATLDWIVAQPWSNGRVGTWGCSALGETQYVLSRSHHPALRALAPSGAGGAIGSAAGRYSYFSVYEGGIFELASGFGWFVDYGPSDPHAAPMPPLDIASAIAGLPVADLVQRHRPGPNGYDDFMRLGPTDPRWHELGYLDDTDVPPQPTFELNTWGDQSVGDSLAYLAFVAAAHRGPVSLASVLAAQFATVAVVVATVFFGERPRARQLVGVGLVIVAVTAIAAVSS